MTMSNVARTLAALSLAMMASAQIIVMPTNATLPSDEQSSLVPLTLLGGPLFQKQSPYNIAPLTEVAGKGKPVEQINAIYYQARVKLVGPSNLTLMANDLAFISCDDREDSNMSPSDVVAAAGRQTPAGIVLYSNFFNECNLTGTSTFQTIYTMTKLEDTQQILDTIGVYPDSANLLRAQVGNSNSTANGGSSSSSNGSGGAAPPTTAVAMSILYSITGIITLLFLIIIATGAVRAHRHPERYGPRNGYSGRPRQSRAKGLARAMLETLPIVKFGDPEPTKPGSRDVELENGSALSTAPTRTDPQESGTTTSKEANAVSTSATAVAEGGAAKDAPSGDAAASASSVQEGDLGCSICTEDFTTGEDVRVLPCNHKYHPACIDPWLLNVSGTCPLCRHDLRSDASANSEGASPTGNDELAPPLNEVADGTAQASEAAVDDPANTRHRRRTRLLDLTRLRHAPPDERIAALRLLREQSRAEGELTTTEAIEDPETQQTRRARLTGRLRDRFRIRTREQAGTSTPQTQ